MITVSKDTSIFFNTVPVSPTKKCVLSILFSFEFNLASSIAFLIFSIPYILLYLLARDNPKVPTPQ